MSIKWFSEDVSLVKNGLKIYIKYMNLFKLDIGKANTYL